MRVEKAAWRIANEKFLKLTTICPALNTGPQFCHRNPTTTIAYLKGATIDQNNWSCFLHNLLLIY